MTFTHLPLLGLAALVWAVCTARYVWWRFFSYQGIPKHLPWAGAPSGGAFSRAKASFRSFFGLRTLLLDGYEDYSKQNQTFILPNIVNGHEVIIPTHQMSWLLEQPEDVLSQYETNRQFMCGDYTMLGLLGPNWPRMPDIVRREMTRDLDDFVDAIADETQDSLKSLWGSKTDDWHEINLYDVMLEVVARVSNRVFVGLPHCRNPGYVQATMGFSKYVLLWAMAIEMLPQIFKPIFGPLLTAYDFLIHYRRIKQYITPLLQDRLAKQQSSTQSLYSLPDTKHTPPNDYITWSLRDLARACEDPRLPTNQSLIARRLAITSFTAIQSSAITITNAVVDIAATPLSASVQDALRTELTAHFATLQPPQGKWTRSSLAKLPKLDSVLTETLRLWGILTHGVTKAVVAPGGVTLPSGEVVPCGAKVGVASYGPHLDGSVYGVGAGAAAGEKGEGMSSPFVWDGFRFEKLGVGVGGMEKGVGGEKKKVREPGLRFVTTSEFYMGFSHGRHACPGRFFANSLLKILLGHIVLMYDIKPIQERPANPWLNNTIGPPIGAMVKIRRRKEPVVGVAKV